MIRSRKEVDDMYYFLDWAAAINTNGTKRHENAINNIQCAIDEVELELDETESLRQDKMHWFNEAQRLKKENEFLRENL
jgi:hypothetical protein